MANVRTPDPELPGDDNDGDSSASLPGFLSEEALAETRGRVPILYVEAVPVITDEFGKVSHVGVLLRANNSGEITRTLVSGRVMHGETVRSALMRHLEKDLGPAAFPQLPASIAPFTVAEYFPWPGVSGLSDSRQHAVALAYVVTVSGVCEPRQDALELTWLTPEEASDREVLDDMEGGRGALLQQALAHLA